MVFINLRATHTPTRDLLMGLKKATGLAHHKIRRAFVGTKISRNPELSLSKQEVSKALARFQKKLDQYITREEQKNLEDFLNKQYKVQKKEQIKKNIERTREAEKETRVKAFKKTREENKSSLSSSQLDNSSRSRLDLSKHSLPEFERTHIFIPSQKTLFPKKSNLTPTLLPSTEEKTISEPDDLPID